MDMNSLDPDSRMGVKVLSGYRIESRPPRRDPHMVPQPSPGSNYSTSSRLRLRASTLEASVLAP